MTLKVEFLPASNGDCIFISINNDKFILIDGGYATTYSKFLTKKLNYLQSSDKNLDLVVVTHVDSDHIRGVLKLLGSDYCDLVKKVWFNSGKILSSFFNTNLTQDEINLLETQNSSEDISIPEGIKLETKLSDLNISNVNPIKSIINESIEDIEFTLLSPNEEKLKLLNEDWNEVLEKELKNSASSEIGGRQNDYDKTIEDLIENPFDSDDRVANGSSIAFILKYSDSKFLFLADAHMDVIIKSLKELEYSTSKPLTVKFVKLSHHGSKKNLNEEFLSLIDTDTYIISTKGSVVHNHPNKETLAKIINYHKQKEKSCTFVFNYPKTGQLEKIFNELNFNIINDTFFHIEYNEEYDFYLKYPKNSTSGAVLNYEL